MDGSISNNDAAKHHAITTFHNRADGEARFRLKKGDGTAYIRTEAEDGGWQSSHVHEHVLETYVVQSGWMGFAELIGNERVVSIYEPNEIVTARPLVIHNVYLPKGAVIHTVKHGQAEGDDKVTNENTAAFDKVTRSLSSDSEVRAAAIRVTPKARYTDEYRHFDNLIWQVPAWSTAICALSIPVLLDGFDTIDPVKQLASGLLALFTAAALACFAMAMLRFRIHQQGLKGYKTTPKWYSASTITQFLITSEITGTFAIGLPIFDMIPILAVGIGVLLGILIIVLSERWVSYGKARFTDLR